MLMLPLKHLSAPRIARLSVLCASLALAACASKNPLLDDKPAAAASATTAAAAKAETKSSNNSLDAKTTELTRAQRFLWFFSPYRITIQQGNFISQEMVAQVKVGMTKDQIRFLLGTPLLTDVFHGERWDYPFRLEKGSGETTTSRIAIFFKEGRVERLDSGELPTEKDYLIRIAGPAPGGK